MVAICRIGGLLKKFKELHLNERHMMLHAVFLSINLIVSVCLSVSYLIDMTDDLTLTADWFYFVYFLLQPLSFVMMLYVITKLTKASGDNANNNVQLYVDDNGLYKFIRTTDKPLVYSVSSADEFSHDVLPENPTAE